MNQYVHNYIRTKRVTKKASIITPAQINGLEELIGEYGPNTFIRGKSTLSFRIIEDTIPTMLANGIVSIADNLKKLSSVTRNSYEHYQLLYGDNAKQVYRQRTVKSTQTLDNFKARHGEELGFEKYNKLLQKRSVQNTLNGFVIRHGEKLGFEKYNEYKKKLKYKNTLEYYINQYGIDLGDQLYNERYPSEYDLTIFQNYKKSVYKLSNQIYQQHKDQINPDNYPRTRMGVKDGWQLDHIKPVNECFKENISIEDASSISNLRMLPWKENLMRNFNV